MFPERFDNIVTVILFIFLKKLFEENICIFEYSSGLYYKQVLYGHLSVNLNFCVINLKFMSKCP